MQNNVRPLCCVCGRNPVAPNYWRDGIRHWRSRCSGCIRVRKQLVPPTPRWQLSGYKKKMICDVCDFRAVDSRQISVWHSDGDLNNTQLYNLRSICLNCCAVVGKKNATWRRGDLTPD